MKKQKFFSWIIALVMFVLTLPMHLFQVNANDATVQTSAFNGIALTKEAGAEGGVALEQYALSTQDLSSATYLSVRYYNPTDGAWPVFFRIVRNNTVEPMNEGTPYAIYDDNFQLIENKQVQYGAVAPTPCSSGYIVLPATVFNNLGVIEQFWINLPDTTAVGVSMHFGSVAYYTETNPDLAMDMVMLTDFAGWTPEWFVGREVGSGVARSIVKAPATGLIGGIQITQTNAGAVEGLMINRFTANNAVVSTVDFSGVEYFAVEYANLTSEYSATQVLMQDTAGQYAMSAGAELIYLNHDFTYNRTVVAQDPYLRANTNECGWILIPKTAFAGMGNTVVAMYLLMSAYTPDLNGGAWQFGRVLTYGANADYTQGTVIADLSKWDSANITPRMTGASCIAISRVQAPEYTVAKSIGDTVKVGVFDKDSVYTPVSPVKANSAFIGWDHFNGATHSYLPAANAMRVSGHLAITAAFVDFAAQGVTIKTTETRGLRFVTGVSTESKQLLANLGLTATYGTRLTNPSLGYLDIPVINWFDAEETSFTAVLKGFGAAHYNLVFTAQAYVEIAGVRYYAEATQSGSLAQVAHQMLHAPEANFTQAELDYLTPIANAYAA